MKYIIKFICFIILFAGNITKSQNTSDIFWDVKVPVSTAILAEEQDILILVTNKNEIQFWELSTREYLKTFSEMGSDIISLALSNNGKLLACGGRDNYICVYDIVQKKLINKITVNNKLTTTLLFNIDGTEVITGGYDNLIKKWNISTGKLINSFDAKCPITMIKFNENNDSYICGLFDGTIIEVNSAFTEIIKIIKTGSYLSTFDLSNYGDFIITSGCDEGTSSSTCQNSTVKTWDIRTSQLLSSKTFLTKPLKSFFLFNNNQTLMGLNDITFIKKIFISAGVLGADEIINTGKHKIVNIFKMREESSLIAITEEGKFIFVDNNIMLGAVNFGNQDIIKAKVEKKINEWQKKGKFEKSEDYKKRVNEENRNVKIQQYVAETINELASSKIKIDFSKATNEYDADNEVFKIMFNNLTPLYVKVPIEDAESFDSEFNKLLSSNAQFILRDDNQYSLVYLKISNPKNNKEYIYDSRTELSFYTSTLQLNFDDIDIGVVPKNIGSNVQESIKNIDVGRADVDVNLPVSKSVNPNAIAVIIGNKDYQKTSKVEYSLNDARSMKDYLVNVFGFKEGNIIYEENASKGIFEIIFGSKENPKGKLSNYVVDNLSDVFIYYSGHGAPGLKDQQGYFVPTEADPNYVEISGYPLNVFYTNISKIQARTITVVLDACFSGANVYKEISPITITMDVPELVDPRIVLLSSSSGTEVSSWFEEKQHGLFTYYFLKAIHNKNSDTNRDNKLSIKEIYEYITGFDGVNYQARRKGIEQNPRMIGNDINRILVEW